MVLRRKVSAHLATLRRFRLFPGREERAPLVRNRDWLTVMGNRDVHDGSVAYNRVALITHFLPDDEAGVADGSHASADAEVVAGECLRLIRSLDLSHDRPQTRLHVGLVRHVSLECRPSGALEQCE